MSQNSQNDTHDLQVAKHFSIVVYPFQHALTGSNRTEQLAKLEDRWKPWWSRLEKESLQVALDDTYFFLPHVRALLFPETSYLRAADAPEQAQGAAWLTGLSASVLSKRIPRDAVLRLTFNHERLAALHPLRLESPRMDLSAPFRIAWVDVALFPQNVGFLMAKVESQLENNPTTVSAINDFLYHLRLILPPRIGWDMASWKHSGRTNFSYATRDIVDFLLQGLTAIKPSELSSTIEEFLPQINSSGHPARYTATKDGQVYGQAFRVFTFACLSRNQAGSSAGSEPFNDATPFGSASRKALYELATCTDTRQPDYVPHELYLDKLWRQNLIAIWDNWQGMALHDHVVFLGLTDEGFPIRSLPHNVEWDYFHLYLLTLFQKTRLSLMFGELVQSDEGFTQSLRATRKLWDEFIVFQNCYWYSEVTSKIIPTELYRRYQQGLEVVSLYDEMVEQIRELEQHFERKFQRRINRLITILTVFTGLGMPAGIMASIYGGSRWLQEASWGQISLIVLGVYIPFAVVFLFLWTNQKEK
jgi:hypothetical protein